MDYILNGLIYTDFFPLSFLATLILLQRILLHLLISLHTNLLFLTFTSVNTYLPLFVFDCNSDLLTEIVEALDHRVVCVGLQGEDDVKHSHGCCLKKKII